MSEQEKVIVMFNDKESYEKHKREVLNAGGTIVQDYGSSGMGFSAIIPQTLLAVMESPSLDEAGIYSIERDSKVSIQ